MIKSNLDTIKKRIFAACLRRRRDPSSVVIIAVSKGRAIAEIKEALEDGITHIGENKVQEAVIKYDALPGLGLPVVWHMVGHLQTNKVKSAVMIFDLIHSVDSLRLAIEIDRQAAKINKNQDILLQINSSGENSKFGIKTQEAVEVIKKMDGFKNINIKGLMTIAPAVSNPEDARAFFAKLRELKDEINARRILPSAIDVLSMGMTDDFEIAIEEGSNMVRLGRVLYQNGMGQ